MRDHNAWRDCDGKYGSGECGTKTQGLENAEQ